MGNGVYSVLDILSAFDRPTIADRHVTETDDGWDIVLDIPGIPKSNVEVDCTDNMIKVKAKAPEGSKRPDVEKSWQIYGATIDDESVSATVVDGVLTVKVPRKVKARRISLGD